MFPHALWQTARRCRPPLRKRQHRTGLRLWGLCKYQITDNIGVDFAPRLMLNVKESGASTSTEQLDFMSRLLLGTSLDHGLRIYALAGAGYSVVFIPNLNNSSRFIAAFGGGAAYSIMEQLAVTFELTYQLGFQSQRVGSGSRSYGTNFFGLTAGLLYSL